MKIKITYPSDPVYPVKRKKIRSNPFLKTFERRRMMLPDKQKDAYTDFYNSARFNEILEPKTTLMLHLASAMAIGCYP